MTEKYTLNNIFHYESVTRYYCVMKGNSNLPPRELIKLAAMEEEFNMDYALYLHFKHTLQIEEFIKKKDIGLANSLPFITDDVLIEESEYERQISSPNIFDALNTAINYKKWDLVFYIYKRESTGLSEFISKTEDEFNTKKDLKNRKFFIIQ